MGASEYMPAGHVVAVKSQLGAQGRLYLPAAQLTHATMVVFAVKGLYVPAVQQVQEESSDVYCAPAPKYT